jgi:hypothetical protein
VEKQEMDFLVAYRVSTVTHNSLIETHAARAEGFGVAEEAAE